MYLTFVPDLVASTDRGDAVQAMMEAMRDDKAVPCLSGWRNEVRIRPFMIRIGTVI